MQTHLDFPHLQWGQLSPFERSPWEIIALPESTQWLITLCLHQYYSTSFPYVNFTLYGGNNPQKKFRKSQFSSILQSLWRTTDFFFFSLTTLQPWSNDASIIWRTHLISLCSTGWCMHPFIFHRKTFRAGCPLSGVETLICPSANPEEGEIYGKHDSIMFAIYFPPTLTASGDTDSCYDDHIV